LDQKNRRVRFLRKQDTYITFGGHSKFGLIVERRGKTLQIKHIVPGTPACRRGLHIGDILEGINRQYSADYDEQALQRAFDESDRLLLHVARDGHHLIFKLDAE
jgi:predicted metalloprotease with PDZ domain